MSADNYTEIITDEGILMGYIHGSSKILFIKGGQGGTIYGEENKYLRLAREVNEKYGLSVFVSATEDDSEDVYLREMAALGSRVANGNVRMYYLGVSKGGLIGLWYGKSNPVLRNILTVNAPLMINFYSKTLPAIKELTRDRATLLYGSLDPSYKYLPFVEKHASVRVIEGADHNLVGSPLSIRDVAIEWLEKSLPSGDHGCFDK